MRDTRRFQDCKLEAAEDACFEDDAEAEEPEEFEENWWPAEQENGWWLAGAIARHYEEAGLIQKSDQFDWSWHQEFDHEIEAAVQSVVAAEGCGGGKPNAGVAHRGGANDGVASRPPSELASVGPCLETSKGKPTPTPPRGLAPVERCFQAAASATGNTAPPRQARALASSSPPISLASKQGPTGTSPARGPGFEGGNGGSGEGGSAGAEASGASGLGAGPEFGAGFGSGFGGSGF